MSADIEKKGLPAPTATLSSAANQPQLPDVKVSAAAKRLLGGTPGEAHLPVAALKRGQEIARRAKVEKPGAPRKGSPGKVHIGPRSGHK